MFTLSAAKSDIYRSSLAIRRCDRKLGIAPVDMTPEVAVRLSDHLIEELGEFEHADTPADRLDALIDANILATSALGRIKHAHITTAMGITHSVFGVVVHCRYVPSVLGSFHGAVRCAAQCLNAPHGERYSALYRNGSALTPWRQAMIHIIAESYRTAVVYETYGPDGWLNAMMAVCQANARKVRGGPRGLVKPPGWTPPDLTPFVRQATETS